MRNPVRLAVRGTSGTIYIKLCAVVALHRLRQLNAFFRLSQAFSNCGNLSRFHYSL